MIDLTGQSILITGASKGIGAAAAGVLLAAGANVIGTWSSAPAVLNDLSDQYGDDRLLILQTDLSDPKAVEALWRTALSWKGDITGLVNNAGIMPAASVEDSLEDWRSSWASLMQVNLQAVADLCKFAIEHFKSVEGRGRIVNIASRAAHRGDGVDYMHYAASKGAVISLTKSIARGFAREDIYAFSIAPGWVKTGMASIAYEPGNEWMLDEVPTGIAAPPEEVGNMIAFLLSGLADQMTGSTLDVNGASYVR